MYIQDVHLVRRSRITPLLMQIAKNCFNQLTFISCGLQTENIFAYTGCPYIAVLSSTSFF